MALWRISVKRTGNINGIRLEQGMFVEMPLPSSMSDPLRSNITQNKPVIGRLFENKYGIDLLSKGLISSIYLEATKM